MRIGWPKPIHGWRAFSGEVGIIVLGVLLALLAQQVAESLEWASRVREAQASMTVELGEDDGAQAHARLAIGHCIDAALEQVEQQLLAERDRNVPFHPDRLSPPPFRTWDNDAWRAAVTSNTTSHMTTKAMYDWSSPYALIGDMDQAAVHEYNDWARLTDIQSARTHPSEPERERLLDAIANARRDNHLLGFMSGNLVRYAAIVGVRTPEQRRRAEIALEASDLPGCTPRLERR